MLVGGKESTSHEVLADPMLGALLSGECASAWPLRRRLCAKRFAVESSRARPP